MMLIGDIYLNIKNYQKILLMNSGYMLELIRKNAGIVPQTCGYKLRNKKLSGNEIRDIINNNSLSYEDWILISEFQTLSEDFIREFKDDVNWYYISGYQTLSEDFIREFKNDVDWSWVSSSQKLSEDFIREFKDDVDWYFISECQVLSEDFIR